MNGSKCSVCEICERDSQYSFLECTSSSHQTPVVLCTIHGLTDEDIRFGDEGVNWFLCPPCGIAFLKGKIRSEKIRHRTTIRQIERVLQEFEGRTVFHDIKRMLSEVDDPNPKE